MRIKYWFFGVILLAMLAACSPAVSQVEPTAQPVATEVEVVLPSSTPEATVTPTQANVQEDSQPSLETGLESECTLVSSLPDPPQEYADLFAVTRDDWVVGPEDASITLIEYGDFQ